MYVYLKQNFGDVIKCYKIYFHKVHGTINIKQENHGTKTEDNKTALIIIDIQNDYFLAEQLASADDTAAKAASVCLTLERRNACYPRATPRTSRRNFLYPIQKVLKSIKYDAS
jgi:hypothetical protein